MISDPVELREGLYNVSAEFGEAERDSDGLDRIQFTALNNRGMGRILSLEALGLPDHCLAGRESISADLVSGADAQGRVIFTMEFSCDCPSL